MDADQPQGGAAVDEAVDDGVLHWLRRAVELQEAPCLLVAAAHERAGVSCVHPERVHELDQDLGLLDGVQVLALEVLLGLGEEPIPRLPEPLVDEAGDLVQAGQLRGPPPPLTGDDDVVARSGLVRPHDDWLADPGPLETVGQRLEAGGVEVLADLAIGSWADVVEREGEQLGHRGTAGRGASAASRHAVRNTAAMRQAIPRRWLQVLGREA